jgi:hypothetical protein
MPHDPDFLKKLSDQALLILAGIPSPDALPEALREATEKDRFVAHMANGVKLEFPVGTTEDKVALVTSEYQALLEAQLSQRRPAYLFKAVCIAVIPSISVLIGGLVVAGWVMRGFRQQ